MAAKKAASRNTNRAKAAGLADKKKALERTPRSGARPGAKPLAMRSTKKDVVLSLLMRNEGASLEEIAAATKWRAHSIRGFLSGTVSKKLGHALSSKTDATGVRRYAIRR